MVETRALLQILQKHRLDDEREKFIELAYNSEKWKKWMLPDTLAGREQKAVIAGHYIFGGPAFRDLKETVAERLLSKGIDLDCALKVAVKGSIMRYIEAFNLSSSGESAFRKAG